MGSNRRLARRIRALKGGRAIVASSGAGIDCVIRDLSDSGALIQFPDPVPMKAAFELYLKAENKPVPINIAWQRGSDVGVEFGTKLNWISERRGCVKPQARFWQRRSRGVPDGPFL